MGTFRRYFVQVLMALALVALSGLAQAAHNVEATGEVRPPGMPRPADEAEAREIALRDAWRQAGAKLIRDPAQLRLFESRVGNLSREELEEGILSADVINQAKRQRFYRVRLSVSFKPGFLEEFTRMGEADPLREVRERRIMIVIPEFHVQQPVPDPAGETEMIRLFLEAGFRVVDQQQVARIRQSDAVKAASQKASAAELLAIAQSMGCEYLIVGEAFSHELPRNPNIPTNMRVCQARLEARMFAVDTGDILVSHGLEATEMAPSPLIAGKNALRTAGGKVAEYFIQRLNTTLESERAAEQRVQFVLAGATFLQKEQLKALLVGQGEDVTSVRDVEFQAERAIVEARTFLPSGDLTAALYRAADSLTYRFEPVEATPGRVVLRVVNRSAPEETPPQTVPVEVNPPRLPADAVPLPADQLASVEQQRWIALIIGVNDYGLSGGNIPSLETARNDAERVAAILRDKYRFDVRLLLDREASISGIQRTFETLAREITPNDNLLVYYAGHGHILPGSSLGLWNVADAKEETDGVYNAQIKEYLQRVRARRVLLISDSCYSGDFLRRAIGRPRTEAVVSDPQVVLQISSKIARNTNPAREVVTSGNLAPVPDVSPDGICRGHSPFACALIDALEQVPAGGAISTTDLFAAIYRRMERADGFKPNEGPQKGALPGHQDGEFFLVRFNR